MCSVVGCWVTPNYIKCRCLLLSSDEIAVVISLC